MDPLAALADLPGVADSLARARTACEELRWHEAYRRRWREVRAEAGIRSARASAALDGGRVPLEAVRSLAVGSPAPAGLPFVLAGGALRASALVESLMPDLGARDTPPLPPFGQLLARVHAAAASGLVADADLGRLRSSADPQDLTGLGSAPTGEELAARLALLGSLVEASRAPALVVAAVVHGELLTLRPFVAGNGVVARAVFRLLLTSRGLDPTGSVICSAGWAASPNPYLGGAAGFATGDAAAVARWIVLCADGVDSGAAAARDVADSVLAGSLSPG
ncbi:Fic family protein [Cellulomonas rhizosphaerae]|uniref:Cell filamentation protein Fic n=1 Tax=Cellulomonas rhizosphaerae TaxID=2293719 RepID=A0A413RI65_9CELL|nr:Fic family protein [Cellulomonas rhizosphaerae]RHA37987.1 cell filamentation protein Fic [Cellulomonas rhizosphaerae]